MQHTAYFEMRTYMELCEPQKKQKLLERHPILFYPLVFILFPLITLGAVTAATCAVMLPAAFLAELL